MKIVSLLTWLNPSNPMRLYILRRKKQGHSMETPTITSIVDKKVTSGVIMLNPESGLTPTMSATCARKAMTRSARAAAPSTMVAGTRVCKETMLESEPGLHENVFQESTICKDRLYQKYGLTSLP